MTQARSQKSDHRHPGVNLFQIDDPGFMTQAPTPGPLSAEDWASLADLHTLKGWLHGVSLTPDWNDMVADGGVTVAMVVQQEAGQMASRVGRVIDNFRLAPTAPVETSGSERESIKEALIKSKGWPHDLHPGPAADAILALLSARPLALGGQHSGGEDFVVVPINPSEEMLKAGNQALSPWVAPAMHAGDAYQAMIAARHFGSRDHIAQRVFDCPELRGEFDMETARKVANFILSTTPARAEAQDEGALSVLDRLLNYSGARGSFDAMKHGDAVKDAEELLRSVKSPGHTDLMVTPESIDAYMRVNPMEAQDEGAAGELKPCPFCGGEAEIIHLDDGDNAGGSCVCCTKCQASGNVEFGRKENFVDNWNRRAHPSPTPAADADRVREVLEFYGNEDRWDAYDEDQRLAHFDRQTGADFDERGQKARDLLAALKSEGK